MYADIHKYLLSKADTNSKIHYPEYIKDYPDANIENEKRKFRNLCNNYSLNNYNELCFKQLKKRNQRENKSRRKNRDLKKLKGDFYLLKIPYKTDIL